MLILHILFALVLALLLIGLAGLLGKTAGYLSHRNTK